MARSLKLSVLVAAAVLMMTTLVTVARSQTAGPGVEWTKREVAHLDGSAEPGSGSPVQARNSMALDQTEAVFITGNTYNGTDSDVLTIKYNPDGSTAWSAVYDSGFADYGSAITLLPNQVVVTGRYRNAAGNFDYLTISYDAAGNQQWVKTFDRGAREFAATIGSDGNAVYVTGDSKNPSGTVDVVTVKYGRDGTEEWVRVYDRGGDDRGEDLAVGPNGHIYVAATSADAGGSDDFVTIRYSSAGEEIWARPFQTSDSSRDRPYDVLVGPDGAAYVTGIADGRTQDALTVAYEPTGVLKWFARYDAGSGEHTFAAALDPSGNVIVAGGAYNGRDFDYLAIKYDSSGERQWVRTYDRDTVDVDSNDFGHALAVDTLGRTYVMGSSWNGKNYDWLIVRLSPSGVEEWIDIYDGANTDFAQAVATTHSGKLVVTGSSLVGSSFDFRTIKYDQHGDREWSVKEPPTLPSHDETPARSDFGGSKRAMGADDRGNVYISAHATTDSGSSDPLGGGDPTCPGPSSFSSVDGFYTVKYGPDGSKAWARQFDGGLQDRPAAIAVGPDGASYVTGSSLIDAYPCAHWDVWTVKYTAAGHLDWAARYFAPLDDFVNAVTVDREGNAYVVGTTSGGSLDFFTAKYDSRGRTEWVKTYEGGFDEVATAVAVDDTGDVYVTGITGLLSHDIVTIKYSPAGQQEWVNTVVGPGEDAPTAIALGSAGNIYVAGTSDLSGSDIITVKYDPQGDERWSQRHDAGPLDSAVDLGITDTDEIIVAGTSVGAGREDFLTISYEPDGTENWAKRFDSGDRDSASALTLTKQGTIGVTGSSSDQSGSDYQTIVYDGRGTQLWAAAFDAGSDDRAASIVESGAGLVVTGQSQGANVDLVTVSYETQAIRDPSTSAPSPDPSASAPPQTTSSPSPDPSVSPTPTSTPSPSPRPSGSASPGSTPRPSSAPSASTPTASNEPSATPSQPPQGGPAPSSSSSTVYTSLFADRSPIRYGGPLTLEGSLIYDGTSCGPSEHTVSVRRRVFGSSRFKTLRTGIAVKADGTWETTLRVKRNASYVALVSSSTRCEGRSSTPVDVTVRASIKLNLQRRCVAPGIVRGRVLPNAKGSHVRLHKKVKARWRSIDRDRLGHRSRFVLKTHQCEGVFRVVWPGQGVLNVGARRRVSF